MPKKKKFAGVSDDVPDIGLWMIAQDHLDAKTLNRLALSSPNRWIFSIANERNAINKTHS